MKKYILLSAIAIAALFTSCSNDEVEISQGIAVKVDPSNVIAPFTYEIVAGELESFGTSYKLRTRVLAYNDQGLLAAEATDYLTNYASIMNSILYLPEGDYTLLAITDVVERKNEATSFEFWTMTGEDNINTLKLSDAGYIGGKNKILGVASKNVSVSSGSEAFTLNPQAAGALILIEYLNIHQFSNVTEYKLQANRTCDFLAFNSNGQYVTTPENKNNQYSWRLTYINPQESSFASINSTYRYSFSFPMNNVSYRYVYSTSSVTDEVITPDLTIYSLKAGDEYVFILDLCDEDYNNGVTYYYGKINGTSSARQNAPAKKNVSTPSPQYSVPSSPVKSMRVLDLLEKL
jgi:hypothetical protein